MLILAATPMGDVGDASQRLRDALGSADVVAAEDTRRTKQLASSLGVAITGRVVSFYDQVETARLPALVEAVAEGKTVLLVTDAGMPSVSDPGYRLVAACVEADLPVTCLPGPSAVTTALALSGLPVERFCFDGFAPRKQGQRRTYFRSVLAEPRAIVFFERRIASSRAWKTPSTSSAPTAAQRCAVSSPRPTRRSDAAASASCSNGRETECAARSPSYSKEPSPSPRSRRTSLPTSRRWWRRACG